MHRLISLIALFLEIINLSHSQEFVDPNDRRKFGRGMPGAEFCYDDPKCAFDSEAWGKDCKTGKAQSPIDLPVVENIFIRPKPVNLTFNNLYQADDFWLLNPGHTARVSLLPITISQAYMSGYQFENPYVFAQLHFHWGKTETNGSEHTMGGAHSALEAHFVHFDSQFEDLTAAVHSGNKNAVGVVGIFLAPGADTDYNPAFDAISRNIGKMNAANHHKVHIREPLDFTPLLPKGGTPFFRYKGSLTTPFCAEVVQWTVIRDPVFVNPKNIELFRTIMDNHGAKVTNNVRPVQPLNGREIEYLMKDPDIYDIMRETDLESLKKNNPVRFAMMRQKAINNLADQARV